MEGSSSVRVWRTIFLCALLLCAIAIVLKSDGVKEAVLSRMFGDGRDPDEPTEEEDSRRDVRRQNDFLRFPKSVTGTQVSAR